MRERNKSTLTHLSQALSAHREEKGVCNPVAHFKTTITRRIRVKLVLVDLGKLLLLVDSVVIGAVLVLECYYWFSLP